MDLNPNAQYIVCLLHWFALWAISSTAIAVLVLKTISSFLIDASVGDSVEILGDRCLEC